ncbi:MAG: SUMF1/EgtB/PvdO family nonheme iron enzyme [Saprospiraceae bacterium]
MHIKNIFLLLLLGLVSSIPAQKPELFLLSVGVAQYQDAALNLNFCADDARDLAKALQEQTDLYQVMETKVLTDAQATRAAVRTELDLFKKKVTANDLFVFVFSGHGIEDALVPYDFDINDPSATSLLKGDLRSKLNGLGCNYIVLLDACHSGSFTKQVNGKDIRNGDAFALSVEQASQQLAEALGSTDKNAIVVSSSASDQLSYECPGCKHGYFAQVVLDCIAGKAITDPNNGRTIRPQADGNGFLTALGFENYLTEAVRIKTLTQANPQKVRVLRSSGADFPILRVGNAGGGTIPVSSDRDGDGVPDKTDDCPDTYGLKTNKGCPVKTSGDQSKVDSDGDKIPDATDACPETYGTQKAHGCPDADNDGVPDQSDKCKYLAGAAQWEGCPDTDQDGIPNHQDNCPNDYGSLLEGGCPSSDRDKDRVPDKSDRCPDLAGLENFQGCPDTDKDGIPDVEDKCPNEKGSVLRNGCPDPNQMKKAETIIDPTAGTFNWVKGGSFQMGSKSDGPIHSVTVSDFYLGQTEVTQAQWRAVMGENPSRFSDCDDCPVEQVSWDDVQLFITKINNRNGGDMYRLPTEAEWEYAARGGKQKKGYTYAGGNEIDAVGWYKRNADNKTHRVKSKTANALGLYDMSGNVWEWCSDWHAAYDLASLTDPTGASSGTHRIFRGGSWVNDQDDCAVSFRSFINVSFRYYGLGFRLAREVSF